MGRRSPWLWASVSLALIMLLLGMVAVSYVLKDLAEENPLNHGALAVGLTLAAFATALLFFLYLSREIPLWKVSDRSPERARRDAALVSAGIFLSVTGFGTAMLSFHRAQLEDTATLADRYVFVAVCVEVIGIVGLLLLAMGVRFSGEPRLFSIDEEVKGWKTKSYRNLGVALRMSGVVVALAMVGIGSILYRLQDPAFGGIIMAAAVAWIFLDTIGVLLFRGRPPLMGPLHPTHMDKKPE
jgi:hypothetical protein